MNFIFHDYQIIWINTLLLLSIAFLVYLLIGINWKSSFPNFCLCFKNNIQYRSMVCIQNTFEDWFLQYIVILSSQKKPCRWNLKVNGLIDQINKMIKCKTYRIIIYKPVCVSCFAHIFTTLNVLSLYTESFGATLNNEL